jgi:hypothetical protein
MRRAAQQEEFRAFMLTAPKGPGQLVRVINFERMTARLVRTWRECTLMECVTPKQDGEGWWVSFTLNSELGGTYEVQELELLEECEDDVVYANHFGWAYDVLEQMSEGVCMRKWPELVRAIHRYDMHRDELI